MPYKRLLQGLALLAFFAYCAMLRARSYNLLYSLAFCSLLKTVYYIIP